MGKEAKTNAMRMLDRRKISYRAIAYECDEFIDGLHTAEITGAPVEASFKTLLTRGKSGAYYVLVIPIAKEINLKKAARAAGEKSLAMVHVKELLGLTGYVRGGCSPIGMKKPYATFVDESGRDLDEIYVSGGRVGLTLCMKPADLMAATGANYAVIAEDPSVH